MFLRDCIVLSVRFVYILLWSCNVSTIPSLGILFATSFSAGCFDAAFSRTPGTRDDSLCRRRGYGCHVCLSHPLRKPRFPSALTIYVLHDRRLELQKPSTSVSEAMLSVRKARYEPHTYLKKSYRRSPAPITNLRLGTTSNPSSQRPIGPIWKQKNKDA